MTTSAARAEQQTKSRLRCTGKERDQESGLDNFGARYYSSTIGRFLSPDWSAKVEPVPYAKLGNPQSLNLYAYVGNDPLTGLDPDGHQIRKGFNVLDQCQSVNDTNCSRSVAATDP